MNTNDYTIRSERIEDYREVENLVRESFWNVYRPGCSEHYVIHVLRKDPAFVKELDLVMEQAGRLYICATPIGNLDDITNSIKLNVLKTSITIKKVNSKTKLSTRIGDASVENTTYGLYGATDELINTIKINKNGYGTIEDIPFGKYKIKEISPGEGYLLDEKEYEVNINENNSKVELQLEDDIIENMITIHKTYGESTFTDEGNVTFEIYDKDNNIIKSITTDSNGYATFNLSYGTYTLKQINSIEGYEKIEPIKIIVKDDEEQIIELKDYKIKVPNTSTHSSLLKYIFKYAYLLLC